VRVTRRTKSQFWGNELDPLSLDAELTVAVEMDTPLARAALGKISGGYSQGMGPHELDSRVNLWSMTASSRSRSKCRVEDDDADNDCQDQLGP
jgi:hypothetical protein